MEEQFDNEEMTMVESFEAEMLQRVNKDYADAKDFLSDYHKSCAEHYERYFSSRKYKDLKKESRFPYPYAQYMEDRFVSFMVDKLFFKDKPCTLVPSDETKKPEADVKQELFNWMDYKDKMRSKIEKALRDCFRYRVAVAQVDYKEDKSKRVVGVNDIVDGVPVSRVEIVEDIKFKGATVKRIDPTDLFFTEDKSTVDDDEPIMIRSYHNKRYFKKKKYYFNQEQLASMATGKEGGDEQTLTQKRMTRNLNPTAISKRNKLEEIEWQGKVDKYRLYKYLDEKNPGSYPTEIEQKVPLEPVEILSTEKPVNEITEADMFKTVTVPVVEPGDMTTTICSVVGGKVVVRLEETAFDIDRPNIVVGVIQTDEDEILGLSLAEKMLAVSEGLDSVMGILIENFKQSVNAQHVIDTSKIKTGAEILVNKAGGVIETNDDVDKVHRRIEQPKVASDIYVMIDLLKQLGEDATSIQGILSAQGEQQLPTLGANEIAFDQATVGLNSLLKSFEDSYIEPLYYMRDQINIQNLDEEYVYGIVGNGAINWKKATPSQIRANVEFICESSTRESNRMIIIQQILQLIQIAPALTNAGIPFRIDLVVKMLMENFNWKIDQIEAILPLLELEKPKDGKTGVDVNMLLFQGLIDGMGQPTGTGNELPNATNKQYLNKSLRDKSRPNIGV